MRSPFPGMDPYLELRWENVHGSIHAFAAEKIQQRLPPDLRARPNQRVFLEEGKTGKSTKTTFESDAVIVERSGRFERSFAAAMPGGVVTAEPLRIHKMQASIVDRWIELIDVKDQGRLVTVIEFLSRANKRTGTHNERYLKKAGDYILGGVNLVEVDLLRSPRHNLPVTDEELPPDSRAAYRACIHRGGGFGDWDIYPMPLRLPLSTLPIPLRDGDADTYMELQALIDHVYQAFGFDDIDYSKPPVPRLGKADAKWARELIATRVV